MTQIKSLRFGKRKSLPGYNHRIHRASKNRKKTDESHFHRRLKKQSLAELDKKKGRSVLRQAIDKARLWIASGGHKKKRRV